VAWVNIGHYATTFLCLIDEKIPQAVERPLMHGASLYFAILLCVVSDFPQILNHYGRARGNALNQLPTDNVIAIQAKPRDFVRELLQMSLRTIAAFALKRTLQPEIPAFRVFPGTFTKKSIIRCNSGTSNPKIYTNNLPIGNKIYIRQGDNQMQPKSAFAED
jgi:hypothetical protein